MFNRIKPYKVYCNYNDGEFGFVVKPKQYISYRKALMEFRRLYYKYRGCKISLIEEYDNNQNKLFSVTSNFWVIDSSSIYWKNEELEHRIKVLIYITEYLNKLDNPFSNCITIDNSKNFYLDDNQYILNYDSTKNKAELRRI